MGYLLLPTELNVLFSLWNPPQLSKTTIDFIFYWKTDLFGVSTFVYLKGLLFIIVIIYINTVSMGNILRKGNLWSMFVAIEAIPYFELQHTFWWQVCTQRSWKRPFGVGLLVGGLDESGAHLYYNCPSGNYFEYQAFAIGSRSQAAKTYLERRFENFVDSSREDLIRDALIATRETLQGEKLRSSICTVAVLGVGEPFQILDQETVQQLIDKFELVGEEETPAAEPDAAAAEPDAAPDEGGAAERGGGAEPGAAAEQGAAPMDI